MIDGTNPGAPAPTAKDGSPACTPQILTDRELLAMVEQFLDEAKGSGMTATRFGLEVMREGGLVGSLRTGRSLSLRNANKVVTFIVRWRAANVDDAAASPGKCSELTAGAPVCGFCQRSAQDPATVSCLEPECELRPREVA